MRLLPLVTLLLLAFACEDKKPATPGGNGGASNAPPVLATTGSPALNEARRNLLGEIERMEKELDEGKVPEQRFVKAARVMLDNLLVAANISVDAEKEDMTRREHSMLVQKYADLSRRRGEIGAAIREIEELLSQGRPPAGFTKEELEDRLAAKQEELRALQKEEEELRAKLKAKEDTIESGQLPDQGETIHTHDLDAILELQRRLEALEARLKE